MPVSSIHSKTLTTTDSSGEGDEAPTHPPPAAQVANQRKNFASAKIKDISFDDIDLSMPPDVAFRPFMLTDGVKELDGGRVRLSGYMHGGVSQTRGIKEFILLRNRECKFGPGGQADHLVRVFLHGDVSASYTEKVLSVEGVFKIKPFEGPDGFTWSIYELAGVAVTTRR